MRASLILPMVLLASSLSAAPTKSDPCAAQIFIGEAKSVTLLVPCIARDDVRQVMATFFSEIKPEARPRIKEVLDRSGDVTLTITSKGSGE